ncbi:TIGR00299 family protein [Methanosarcinales archaeon ex4572_44]|nr:MAG: TIGR00299 family protein [Methanosarcinales archaeon ex4572_44]RLG26673.1 MAG: nickel pincer cofactor biosynthesis protein LarC [Methanosarcinales archaeon]
MVMSVDLLVFDPVSGASGDMIISALIDLGVDQSRVVDVMESTSDVTVEVSHINKFGIACVRTKVLQRSVESRGYEEVKEHIEGLNIPSEVRADALRVYERLARAESRVHGVSLQDLHFHEVGCDDAIADIVGACTAINLLRPEHIYCNTISIGTGVVETSHGKYPLPAPATLEVIMDSGLPVQQTSVEGELLTPTGAAILAHFVDRHPPPPPMTIRGIGYGAGEAEYEHPNLLRVILVSVEERLVPESIEVLETNIDDVTGEITGHLIDRLLEEGAKDVCIIPVTMKKNRSGQIVQVIAEVHDSAHLAETIIEETGSLGVRIMPARHRLTARRRIDRIQVAINSREYSFRVKIATDTHGKVIDVSAEFDDCREIARRTGIPAKQIIRLVEEKGWKEIEKYNL